MKTIRNSSATAALALKTRSNSRVQRNLNNFENNCTSLPSQIVPKPIFAIGFAIEQLLHVVALACSASGILK
ncbi:MAG: hypothetical protein LBJ00_03585 [Planctomycetaceae bacterium]|nr:hypothetical protein [Planctomycetaceae bacterium]